jgi:putative ABC transport system permease protein
MKIIIKFILKNIKEKKLRTLLITISIAAASALFFASNGISDSYKSAYIKMLRGSYGSADIRIYANKKSPSGVFYTNKAEKLKDRTEYIVGTTNSSGSHEISKDETLNISLKGIDYEDLMVMNPIDLIKEANLKPFNGYKLIISEKMCEKYNLIPGDKFKVKIGESNKQFTVAGVAKQASVFQQEDKDMIAVVPRETAAEFSGSEGKVSNIYIKAKDSKDKAALIEELSEVYKDYTVEETINEKEIDADLQTTKASFMMMLAVVLIMSIFIIYTAFKVIIMERMPIIGTFRSIGATRKMTDVVMITESIIYGVLGGILGDILGIGILYVVGVLMNPYGNSLKAKLEFRPVLLIHAFIFAVIVSFISAILPIIKVSKISVKDIVLNKVEAKDKRSLWKPILAVALTAFSIIAPLNTPPNNPNLVMLVDLIAMVFVVIVAIMIIPYVNNLFIFLFKGIYSIIFGNEGVIAVKNLKNNKSILNNIALLSIGISALLMINVLSFSIGKEVSKAYGAWNSDVAVFPRGDSRTENEEDIKKVLTVDGVQDALGVKSVYNTKVEISNGSSNSILAIDSMEIRKFYDFFSVEFDESTKGVPENFDGDRNIMVTSQLLSKLNVKVGEVLTLDTASGKKDYKIVSIFKTLMNNGDYAFIPERYMKSDFKVKNYGTIFIKTYKDDYAVRDSIKERFKGKKYRVDTIADMEKNNAKANEAMMSQLRAFPFISIVIGAFGVLNNFIISFIERKRALAVMASIGMSKRQTIKMLFIEALSAGLIGGMMGIATGLAMTSIIPLVMKAMMFPIPMHYQGSVFVICMVLGICITLISSITPALKSSKMNIIDAIKYE